MYGKSEEERLQEIISDYKASAELIPLVKRVIWDFDKKVHNIRFQKKLQEVVNPHIFTKCDKYNLNICWYSPKSNRYIALASCSTEKLIDGKRINAEVLIESANRIREHLLRDATNLEIESHNVKQYKARIEEIKQELDNLTSKIPWEIKDIYNIRYRVVNW